MKRNLRIIALALALTLLFASLPAAAYGAGNLLPQKRAYATAFSDTAGTWCDSYVQTCYETALLDGTSTSTFSPRGPLTCAQITVITARLYKLLRGDGSAFVKAAAEDAWYQPYADFLVQKSLSGDGSDPLYSALESVSDTDMADDPCDRYSFVALLSAVLPDSAVPAAINTLSVLPDVSPESDSAVWAFYQGGILTGSDSYGTFNGYSGLTRGQAAAMLARLIDPSQRVKFTPAVLSCTRELLGADAADTALTVDGVAVSAEELASVLSNQIAYMQAESSFAYYEKYAQYWDAYCDDENFNGSFADYLLEKHGIDVSAEGAIQWNTADKAGLTPAQKVLQSTLELLKQQAELLRHADSYPLTAAQKTEIARQLPTYRSLYYGYSDALITEQLTLGALQSNLLKKYASASGDLNTVLAGNGYFYGRCISLAYGSASYSGTSEADARAQMNAIRTEAAAHLGDSEYFSYLIWKYSDDYGDTPDLINVDGLADGQKTALKNLSVGALSAVLQDTENQAFLLFLKDDPSEDENVLSLAGYAPALAQLTKWVETASVTTAPLWDSLNVEAVAAACQKLNLAFTG